MADWVELEWSDTGDIGPDNQDYIAYHNGKSVARVYSDSTILTGTHWRWFLGWYAVPNTGQTESRREAFVEVERLYNLHLGVTDDDQN